MKMRKEVLIVFLALITCGLIFSMAFEMPFRAPWQKEETTKQIEVNPGLVSLEDAFTTIAEQVKPAVVNISTVQVVKGAPVFGFDDAFEDWFFKDFRDFFGNRQREYRQESLGSGFIFKIEGNKAYIFTNNHVVARADEISVKVGDGEELKVIKVYNDQRTDIAVVETEARRGLKTLQIGDSEKIKVGQWVIAVGNPFGFDRTVTVGIISGTGRHLSPQLPTAIQDFIQTDAAINEGNSGGPLLNIRGEVIGINTAIINPAKGQGVGFAVPINLAKEVSDSVIKHGKVVRGALGVIVMPVSEDIAERFKYPDTKGALVSDITSGGPAEKAGIQIGDAIREVDGKVIDSVDTLTKFVRTLDIGKEVTVKVIRRGGEEKNLKVTIGEMPEEGEFSTTGGKTELGLKVEDSPEGVIVTEVEPGSSADRAHIRPRDIILEVDGKSIKNMSDYNKAISSIKEGDNVVLLVQRDRYSIFVVIKPSKK